MRTITEEQLKKEFGELTLIKKVTKENLPYVWTLISGDNESLWYLSGAKLVNRMDYYTSDKPHNFEDIEVDLNEYIMVNEAKYKFIDFLEQEGILTDDLEIKIQEEFTFL